MSLWSSARADTLATPPTLDDGWAAAAPSRFGADVSLLASMVGLLNREYYTGIHSLLVAKDGVLVVEQYFEGYDRNTPHEIRSATKSVGSILTGIAIDRKFVRSERDFIYRYFKDDYEPAGGWSERARRVEIRHLLSMMSGYDCDDLATQFACEHGMYDTDDWVQYALDLPFAFDPGVRWAYNSSSLILVGEAVARSSGTELREFAERYLFGPLGIKRFHWMRSPKGRAWMGGGARMIPREMAKVGQLMLNRGVWNGERIVSERWIDQSTQKQGAMLGGVDYGYLWQAGECYIGMNLVSAFWAAGNGGQYIIVLPESRLVVVFTGGNFDSPLADRQFRLLTEYIVPAFAHPEPLDTVSLDERSLIRLTGEYALEFDSSATSTVVVKGDGIRLVSPDEESIDLFPNRQDFFTGTSRYGPLTVVFETGPDDELSLTVYSNFSRFRFEKR